MICKCKLPIIRGYEPDCYCLNCGLKLKNKTMEIKTVKLKHIDFNDANYKSFIVANQGVFDIEYEPETERKKICVEIEYVDNANVGVKPKDVFDCLTTNACHAQSYWQIKVTEIKPPEISKEDAEWFVRRVKHGWYIFDDLWAEFQAKKEAENG